MMLVNVSLKLWSLTMTEAGQGLYCQCSTELEFCSYTYRLAYKLHFVIQFQLGQLKYLLLHSCLFNMNDAQQVNGPFCHKHFGIMSAWISMCICSLIKAFIDVVFLFGFYSPFKNISLILSRSFIKGGRKPEHQGKKHLTSHKQNLAFPHVTRARLEPQWWET